MNRKDATIAHGTVATASARFLARWGDFGLVFLLFRLGLRPLGLTPWTPQGDWHVAIAASALINACSISLFATTLWKAASGLHVIQLNGKKPHFIQAALREFYAIILGMGCGIPIMAILAGILSGVKVLKGTRAPWDRQLSLQIEHRHSDRGLFASSLIAAALIIEVGLILCVAGRFNFGWAIRGL